VEVLRRAGYEVRTPTSFEAGRHALVQRRPDLLITELRLGSYNGLQLVILARAADPEIPSIVVTGYADRVLELETKRLGAGYATKPLHPPELLSLISETLSKARAFCDARPIVEGAR
jgi:DNA-binding response OmpR family regulator